jgi:hypothetical protein
MVSLNQFDVQQMEDCAADVIEEMHQMKWETPAKRVEDVFQQIKSSFKQQKPGFLLCVLPEKNSDIYGLFFYLKTCKQDFLCLFLASIPFLFYQDSGSANALQNMVLLPNAWFLLPTSKISTSRMCC